MAEQDLGYQREYTIQADAAWIEAGKVLEPAFVTIRNGRIVRVSAQAPRARRTPLGGTVEPQILKVQGTLAAGLVDAWSGLLPSDLAEDGHPLPQQRLADSLPMASPGADPTLAARVQALRQHGLAAAWLAPARGGLQRGLGSAVEFSVHDLPVAAGTEALEFTVGGDRLGAQEVSRQLKQTIEGAVAWRESLEDYQEKLEEFQQDLDKYQKDFEKYLEEKNKADKAEKNAQAPGRLQHEDKKEKGDHGKEVDKKEGPKAPTRPKRPTPPTPSSARDLILDALDGKHAVRVQADDLGAIRTLLALQSQHRFEAILVGGLEADLVAEELADAEVPVVLRLTADADPSDARSLVHRYQTLVDAGVEVALASGGDDGSAAMMLTLAGELIAAGADADAVWASLTTVPARICGLEGRAGRIGQGSAGSMILFGGASPFDASASFRTHKPK